MDLLVSMAAAIRLVGWVLVHFMWQGCLLGLFYASTKAAVPRGEARYWLGMITLIALALCPLLTAWHLLRAAAPLMGTATDTLMISAAPMVFIDGAAAARWTLEGAVNGLLPWLVLAWLCGVSTLSWRAWRQWRSIRMLIDAASATATWQACVDALARRFGLRRRISVLCSGIISTPVLVGWIKPTILLPVAVAWQFPVAQVELILAHELAHLRRWDPLANLFQVALETLYFYHPVVHWISRDVRNEREVCCDRLALVTSGGSRHDFATALAELGELREQHAALALAANGGVLLDRVHLLLSPRPATATVIANPARLATLLIAATLMLVTVRLAWTNAQLQQNLTTSLSHWNAGLGSVHPPVTPVSASLLLRDLVPFRTSALHPSLTLLPATADKPEALLSAAFGVPPGFSAPHISAIRVTDLTDPTSVAPLRAVNAPTAPAVSRAPTPVHLRRPSYPQDALLQGIEGSVTLEFDITADGGVGDLKVVSATPSGLFDQAALQAMHSWKFAAGSAPPLHRYRQTLAFALKGSQATRASAGAAGDQPTRARVGCQISLGSNICRIPAIP